jgi:CzcA family heavy metal efflux pump
MIISDVAIQKRTTVYVVIVMAVLFGVYNYITLPRETTPDISVPFIFVSTSYTGVSPSDMENNVTIPLEKKLKRLRDVEEMRSLSSEGRSNITIEFYPDVDIDVALQKVRDKVDLAKPDLPEDADDPVVSEVSFSDRPIVTVNVVGDIGLIRLKAIADDLEDKIDSLPGVLDAAVIGGMEREIRIEPDPARLAAYEIPFSQLLTIIDSENADVAAGNIDLPEAKFQVRIPGEFSSPQEAQNLILLVRDGNPVYLTDVAEIRDTFKDPESYSRVNGRDTVSISISKRTGENALEVIKGVKAIIAEALPRIPEGTEIIITNDESRWIRIMLSDLENNILSGLILVLVIIFLSMGFINAIFVALAIPMSMLISFTLIRLAGLTLSNVVLFGLILSLGMLVDNAIVIVENIYRHMQEGSDRVTAAREGTSEVAWPVITSTLTTICAFLPMLFWPGIMGEFMGYLPKTVIITLSASLFVAMVINPAICSRLMRIRGPRKMAKDKKRNRFMAAYEKFLTLSLDHPGATLFLCGFMLVATFGLYGRYGHGVEFFAESDPDAGRIYLRQPEGTSLDKTDELVRRVEERLQKYENIDNIVANVGSRPGSGLFGFGSSGSHVARISIDFKEEKYRIESSAETISRIRKDITGFPGVEVEVKGDEHGPPQDPPINIEISGEDFDVLAEITEAVTKRIETVAGLVDLKDDYERARPELRFKVDRRRAALLGVSTVLVANYIKAAVMGNKIGTFRQGEDEYDITLRLAPEERDDLNKVLRLNIPGPAGKPIPLSALARMEYAGGLGAITRIDQHRVITVQAEVEGRLSSEALADVKQRLADYQPPPGYSLSYTGENEEQQEAADFLSKAFIVALFLIALVLITLFNSVALPAIVMVSVILSLGGVLIGLLVVGIPFGIIMTGIGVISLAGVVVNNAIVLIDYVQILRSEGVPRREALIRAGLVRLRPVLLTAVTTILGLMPMATGISFNFREFELVMGSSSSQWWGGMAIAVIFGLAFATMLTLVVVPSMYELVDRVSEKFRPKTDASAKPNAA